MKIYQWSGWRYDAKTIPSEHPVPDGWFASKAEADPNKAKPTGDLTEDQILDIVTSGLSAREIAKQYGITPQKVGALRKSAK